MINGTSQTRAPLPAVVAAAAFMFIWMRLFIGMLSTARIASCLPIAYADSFRFSYMETEPERKRTAERLGRIASMHLFIELAKTGDVISDLQKSRAAAKCLLLNSKDKRPINLCHTRYNC